MKNQTQQAWLWQGLMTAAFLMTVGASNAFADASACANSTGLTLGWQVKIKFCDIPARRGVMIGSKNGESDEKPVKARDFKKFQMGQFEVTQLQYKTVMGEEPWKVDGKVRPEVQEGNDNPAVHVSYYHAAAFARALSKLDKTATYRLPTEAEFEYAARAGTTTNFYWGDKMDSDFAYFEGNTETTGQYARKVDSCPKPVLDRKYHGYCANNFGLYHMLGNVWEWTADVYVDNYTNAPTDGNVAVADNTGSSGSFGGGDWISRVIRGGSRVFSARFLRSATRSHGPDSVRSADLGFRLVRIAK